MIPYGRQDIHESDISAVLQVLKSDFLTQGPVVPRFEDCIARHCGARRAVAVNSATSALHIALLALGVGSGDLVWTSPNTFVASSNAALYCGATIDFVDIDPDTYNMSVVALERKLVDAKRSGQLPKVVIPVHIAGQPCDMERINALATLYSFSVVEDASHAIGAKYKGDPIGNCRYSDIAVFSFHPVKIITTAEGGMAVTNDDSLADKMELYRSHGVTRDPKLMSHPPDGSWYYQQVALGYNYRITETVKQRDQVFAEKAAIFYQHRRLCCTVGEISYALEKVWGRHVAEVKAVSGVYAGEMGEDAELIAKVRTKANDFAKADGRRPRILICKMGQDGHDRGQKVIATAFADLGFDVDIGPLFQTPEEAARQAVENDVHIVGASSLAAGHLTLAPALIEALKQEGREDILVVIGGVIPPQDYDALKKAGVAAIFPPGTVIAEAADGLIDRLNSALGYV
jgi:methylmalonyl-CoA mutase cobalamin-binding domain/chain